MLGPFAHASGPTGIRSPVPGTSTKCWCGATAGVGGPVSADPPTNISTAPRAKLPPRSSSTSHFPSTCEAAEEQGIHRPRSERPSSRRILHRLARIRKHSVVTRLGHTAYGPRVPMRRALRQDDLRGDRRRRIGRLAVSELSVEIVAPALDQSWQGEHARRVAPAAMSTAVVIVFTATGVAEGTPDGLPDCPSSCHQHCAVQSERRAHEWTFRPRSRLHTRASTRTGTGESGSPGSHSKLQKRAVPSPNWP